MEVQNLQKTLIKKFKIKLWLSERPAGVVVSKIVIPRERRSEGIGSKVMAAITAWSDVNRRILALTPSREFGGAVARLKKFFKRFGFVPNKGKNKMFQFQETLIRYPKIRKTRR